MFDLKKASDAYKAGEKAAKAGLAHWGNPHCKPGDEMILSANWYAGWCHQKQQRKRLNEEAQADFLDSKQ